MAGLCLAFAFGGFGMSGFTTAILGGPGGLFFGWIAAVCCLRLFDRREQVVIDGKGIFIRSHGSKRIGLRSIDRMKTDMGRLSLYLFKPSKYPIECAHRRFLYRVNGAMAREFYGDAWIWSTYLDRSLAELTNAIWTHRPQTDFEKKIASTVAGWDENGGPYADPAAE
ncbi:hypothetical protein GRI42_10970 [Erythrobacter gaetbuli]|uniref:Uncharacterized protein n=1 Tax=Qipengyuania gaetbuli TaxID=266952 RepID=A0A844Y3C8_9SPHN|nr:hypothetical protein [Qipengyuania gaetbuli]MXO51823.1 hypothetical protein [Qipengyuania gaetbuli]